MFASRVSPALPLTDTTLKRTTSGFTTVVVVLHVAKLRIEDTAGIGNAADSIQAKPDRS